MKNSKNIGMVAIVAMAVGMAGFSLSDGSFAISQTDSSVMASGATMMGHLEVIHRDAEGNILSYSQSDNAILNEGRNCTAVALFGTAANSACSADPGTYDVISLTATSISGANLNLLDLTTELVNGTNAGLGRSDATVSEQGTATAASGTSLATARVSHTFISTGGSSVTVTSAGLVNSTDIDTSSIFAAKDFASSVTMNTNDQLTVNWDIDVSGTEVFVQP